MTELRPYLRLLRGRWRRMLTGALLAFATTAAGVGLLALAGWFITASAVTAGLWAAGIKVAFDVFVPGGAIRAFALTRTAARYAERVYNHDTVLRLLADLRVAVFARLTHVDALSLARFRAAELLNRLTADVDALDTLYLRVLAPPVVALLGVFALSAMLALFAPALAAAALAWLSALWLLVVALGWRGGARLAAAINARTARLRIRAIEHLEGLPELLAFGSLPGHRAATDAEAQALGADQRRLAARTALGSALATLGVQIASVAVLLTAVVLHRQGVLTAPVAVLATVAVLGLGELFAALPSAFLQLGRARSAARRLTAQMALQPRVPEPAAPRPMPAALHVDLRRVSVCYGDWQPPILDAVDLTIDAGERVAVVGSSGCGKTTLADTVARLLDPQAGCVALGGTPLPQLATADVRRRVGYLTQRTDLFADTVAANLRLAAPEASDAALWKALGVAGLARFVAGLPAGLRTQVGEFGRRFSGGQARRLALARVVLRDAPVVILDEPFSGLDADTAAEVAAALECWLSGRTALLLAHATAALPPADRTLRLAGGRLWPDTAAPAAGRVR